MKKEGKFGLVDVNGLIILKSDYDKIKPLGEYVLAHKDSKYTVFDSDGRQITDEVFKDIRLKRNVLQGKNLKNKWQKILEQDV